MAARFPITNYSISAGDVNSLQESPPAWLLIGHNNSFAFLNKISVPVWAARKNRPSPPRRQITLERLLAADSPHPPTTQPPRPAWSTVRIVRPLREKSHLLRQISSSTLALPALPDSSGGDSGSGNSYGTVENLAEEKRLWWDTQICLFFLALNQKYFALPPGGRGGCYIWKRAYALAVETQRGQPPAQCNQLLARRTDWAKWL